MCVLIIHLFIHLCIDYSSVYSLVICAFIYYLSIYSLFIWLIIIDLFIHYSPVYSLFTCLFMSHMCINYYLFIHYLSVPPIIHLVIDYSSVYSLVISLVVGMIPISIPIHSSLILQKESRAAEVTARLTDTRGYTGAHKERFDSFGQGKGKEGRTYSVPGGGTHDGYVGAYKGKGTYDGSH